MFMGEAAGLRAMYATDTLAIPKVYHAGSLPEGSREGNSFIVMVRRCRLTHQDDPGLKALGCQPVETTSLSKLWFQMCQPAHPYIMDFLNFGGRGDQAEFGRQLALMHLAEPAVQQAKVGRCRLIFFLYPVVEKAYGFKTLKPIK